MAVEVMMEMEVSEVKMERDVKMEVRGGKVEGEEWEQDEEMTYEEIRQHRVEANKRKLGELGLPELAKSLYGKGETSVKRSVKRKSPLEEEENLAVRRSSRVAAKPAVTYSEATVQRGERGEKLETRHGLQKQYLKDKHRMAAIDAAEEVLKDIQNSAFIKPLLTSHTTGGFWMGLQNTFCKTYLPAEDEKLMLEANGMEWECVYLAYKNGLSGGWRSFSIDNELRDGDCCIFELVTRRRFVVHIFRAAKGDEEVAEAAKGKKKAGKH